MTFDTLWSTVVHLILTQGSEELREDIQRDPGTYREVARQQYAAVFGGAPGAPARAATPLEAEVAPAELWSPAKRGKANIRAMELLASGRPLTDAERREVGLYSGWGGASIRDNAHLFPAGFPVPDRAGLIHEYYTPSAVTSEVARVLRPVIADLPRRDGKVQTLEPSAGIGRFVRPFTGPGFEDIAWNVIEFSEVSARMLQALRPDIDVFNGTFEEWIVRNHDQIAGTIGLVLANPPYGERGAHKMADPDRDYAEDRAYFYFMRRALDLLAPGGVGVFLVPAGFMTGEVEGKKLRAQILKRHHLAAAFRLPSKLFPGAQLVIDLIFFRARGGELERHPTSDDYIVEGNYYKKHPGHILGVEVGLVGDDADDQLKKPRWGYQIEGTFTSLPPFDLFARPMVTQGAVPWKRTEVARRKVKVDGGDAESSARSLGIRIRTHLASATGGDDDVRRAAAGWDELHADILAWMKTHGNPHRLDAEGDEDLLKFVAAFESDGSIIAGLRAPPVVVERFVGRTDNLAHVLAYAYRPFEGGLSFDAVADTLVGLGVSRGDATRLIERQTTDVLNSGEWCLDGPGLREFVAAADYYSGRLWPKYDRVERVLAENEGESTLHGFVPLALIGGQSRKLRAVIAPMDLADLLVDHHGAPLIAPNQSWIPLSVVTAWARSAVQSKYADRPLELTRDPASGLLYANRGSGDVSDFLAWCNNDDAAFSPQKVTEAEKAKGGKKLAQERVMKIWTESFVAWVGNANNIKHAELLADHYNRTFRGHVVPSFGTEPLDIARWTGPVFLRPHQIAGARRVLHNRRGLIAFDVGVGKTYTGIAVLAKARQEGWARRPVVLVPNTLVWKWKAEIERALPDYRVGIVGSRMEMREGPATQGHLALAGDRDAMIAAFRRAHPRKKKAQELLALVPAGGAKVSELGDVATAQQLVDAGVATITLSKKKTTRTDTSEERTQTWARFQAGEFDVVILTFSMLGRTMMDRDAIHNYIKGTPAILRTIEQADDRANRGGGDRAKAPSERKEAELWQRMEGWAAELMELPDNQKPDNILWDDIGVDMLVVDEAQNFKNLYGPEARQGAVPDFMGSAGAGSKRSWRLDFRCASIHRRTGGTGVVLLSATPAKNSPLEYYNLMQYVDHNLWLDVGIVGPEQFIARYLHVKVVRRVDAKMEPVEGPAVMGFLNVPELRDIVFRYGEFKTAEEVGLVLPEVASNLLMVKMQGEQDRLIGELSEYLVWLKKTQEGKKYLKDHPGEILATLGRMAAIAIHPDLPGAKWNDKPSNGPHSPKFKELARRIVEATCKAQANGKPACGHIVFVESVAAHQWLREVLIEACIEPSRIALLNAITAPTPADRSGIADGFNGPWTGEVTPEGDLVRDPPLYDVVIANSVAYEGIDLQVRTCAIHHLDLPWEPATIQQRNGRGVRQGNELKDIEINYYLGRRTPDGLRYAKIMGKHGWMKQFLTSQDRSTNNPGAQAGLSEEETLLMVARVPSQVRELLRATRRRRTFTERTATAMGAGRDLRSVMQRLDRAAATRDVEKAIEVNAGAKFTAGRLASVDPEAWPYSWVVPHVLAGARPFVAKNGVVFMPGTYMQIGDGIYEIGRQDSKGVYVRRASGTTWDKWTDETGGSNVSMIGSRVEQAYTDLVARLEETDPPIDTSDDIDTGPDVEVKTGADQSEGGGEKDATEEALPMPSWMPLAVEAPSGDARPTNKMQGSGYSNKVVRYASDAWRAELWAHDPVFYVTQLALDIALKTPTDLGLPTLVDGVFRLTKIQYVPGGYENNWRGTYKLPEGVLPPTPEGLRQLLKAWPTVPKGQGHPGHLEVQEAAQRWWGTGKGDPLVRLPYRSGEVEPAPTEPRALDAGPWGE